MVLPAMDHIDADFESKAAASSELDESLRSALGLARKTLNRYYSMTDWSDNYKIAMG